MRIERIVREIELFIIGKLGKHFKIKTSIMIEDEFRCVCVSNESIDEISDETNRSLLAMLYVEYGLYISEIIDIIKGKLFNIYLYDDHYIRTEKIKKIKSRCIN